MITPPPVFAAGVVGVQDASADKLWVQYLARFDPRSTVRIGAWQALLSSAPDAAIAQFVATGFDYAVKLSQDKKARNMDFARRVLAAYTAEFAPEVHAAAQFAVDSRDDADRERFANGGFEAAKKRDTTAREAKGEQAKALVEADRQFVRNLAVNDPGAQVRVSASYATRAGATDSDLVDFFATGWAFGARLDLEVFRQQAADNDTRWRATLSRLMADAQAAEQAAKDATSEVEKAKAAAVAAWKAVGEHTGPARSAWDEAQELARKQAANWAAVYAAAAAASGPNWAAIAGPAQTNQSSWDAEREFAAQQAQYWKSLLQQALDGEQRVRTS
ncbi:hypothetical protein [Amycolatopsis samaneae]|uniref:Uncharacterized protein n=1 Tax=Amycolatopsis samaneae TaxID=664691 RepID=A0ABW5GX17_9PSEU